MCASRHICESYGGDHIGYTVGLRAIGFSFSNHTIVSTIALCHIFDGARLVIVIVMRFSFLSHLFEVNVREQVCFSGAGIVYRIRPQQRCFQHSALEPLLIRTYLRRPP